MTGRTGLVLAWALLSPGTETLPALTLVEEGRARLPVIVAADAPPATIEAAQDLADYLAKIGGARPEVCTGAPDPAPGSAIWVGLPPDAARLFPGQDLAFRHPEEILLLGTERHLLIAGRDRLVAGRQTEFGTANAVYTFLQKQLGVRWLWPGDLGEDLLPRTPLTLDPFLYRFHPPIRERLFFYPRHNIAHADEVNRWMDRFQRCRGSLETQSHHSFQDWSDLYFKEHPEYFGLQPDGTRLGGISSKLCVSNPEVLQVWLARAEEQLRANPEQDAIGITPNDGGGWCFCPTCCAWDHPDGGRNLAGHPSMTERYLRFWNLLAQGLRERLPGRTVRLDALAYSRYSVPPVALVPDAAISIGYVGSFPIADEKTRAIQKDQLRQWSKLTHLLRYRPNLFGRSGGTVGLPVLATRRTIEDFRFLAEQGVQGIAIDSILFNFALLGPQNYLMLQLAYDPLQDGEALLADYYTRGFGPAAGAVRAYFEALEAAHDGMLEQDAGRREPDWAGAYPSELFLRLDALLKDAEARVVKDSDTFRRRVAFVRTGCTFTTLQVEILQAVAEARRSQSRNRETVDRAFDLLERRKRMLADAEPFALDPIRIPNQIRRRETTRRRLGDLPEEWRQAPAEAAAKPVRLAAPRWKLVFEDRFERETLGNEWEALEGVWTIQDGQMVSVSQGALVMPARTFPGLQKIEFEATAPASAAVRGRVSDLSPVLHAAAQNPLRSGYFLQFGGQLNRRNALLRLGDAVDERTEPLIQPGRVHHLVAEFDGRCVRLTADGVVALEYAEPAPLLGPGHDRLGVYIFTGARIDNVRVYEAEALVLPEGLSEAELDDLGL